MHPSTVLLLGTAETTHYLLLWIVYGTGLNQGGGEREGQIIESCLKITREQMTNIGTRGVRILVELWGGFCQLYQITSILIKLMAFVFRGEKPQPTAKINPVVGPGSYNFEVQRENKIPKAYVPFGSMEPKARENLHPTTLVGPGSYNIDVQHSGEKIIVSSETEDIKILEISRPHPVFKSGVARFQEIKEELISPGPGQYNHRGIEARPKMLSTNTTSKPKILQHLINLNQYQSIPSIPSNVHAFGYNENDNNELELNQPPIEYFKGEKEDRVGPGQYNPNVQQVKARGISWSQPKAKKIEEVKTNPQIGPGSYEVTTINALYNYKPSCNFASKTMRTMDQRKGAVLNAKAINEEKMSNATESRMLSEKAPPSTQLDSDQDSEYEYIDDTTPGPGAYMEISKVSRPKAGKTATSFGGSKRFEAAAEPPAPGNIGPGSYDVNGFNFGKKIREKRVNRGKEQPRCPSLINNNVLIPGPGSYEPRNTMEDKLIYKIQRGYRGQFGSTEARSKDPEEDELPGPASYNPQTIIDEKEVSAAFKSKIERKLIDDRKTAPPVGSYNLIYSDIATKIIKEEEEDPDLIIKKPGFGVGEARFKETQKPEEDYEDDDIIKEIQEKHRQERKLKMLKNNSVFKSKETRFKDPRINAPGPGAYYDGEEDYWNKRTYNILFADI